MSEKWIVTAKPRPGAKMRLFCFPYSGGGARVFKPWGDLLPPSIEVCAIQYPGRGSRFSDPLITDMATMVAEIHGAMKPMLNRPCAFFGHSLGGGIALDLAKHLEREGIPVSHLFISGRRAAHLPRNRRKIAHLPEEQFREELFQMGGTSKDILDHPELMELVSPMLRADFSISEKYIFDPSQTLTCPLTAFGGEQDPLVEKEAIQAWSQHTKGPFSYHFFPGAHFFLDSDRDALLQQIKVHLKLV